MYNSMVNFKQIKLFIGLFYIIVVSIFLYYIFTNFKLDELTSYEFIKNNRNYFFDLKEKNLIFLSFLFIMFVILWVFACGFVAPLAIFSGFVFGKWLGLIFLLIGMTIGATGLYIFANFFLKDIIKKKFFHKYKNLQVKFKKSEFSFLLIYRFIGGIPFALSNILPCIFNVKIKNFFFATLIGIAPQLFLIVAFGSGLEVIIDKANTPPNMLDLLFSKEIYIPIILFILILIFSFFLKKVYYKN